MSLFAGITLTWYVICLPGNSQPQLRVSMGRGMLPPHSRGGCVTSLLAFWYGPSTPSKQASSSPHISPTNAFTQQNIQQNLGVTPWKSHSYYFCWSQIKKKKKRQHVTGVGPHITGNGNCPAMAEEGGERVTGTELCLDLLCFLQCDYKTVILVILYGHDIK